MSGRLWIVSWRCADGRRGAVQLDRAARPSDEEAALQLLGDLRLAPLPDTPAQRSAVAALRAMGYELAIESAS